MPALPTSDSSRYHLLRLKSDCTKVEGKGSSGVYASKGISKRQLSPEDPEGIVLAVNHVGGQILFDFIM